MREARSGESDATRSGWVFKAALQEKRCCFVSEPSFIQVFVLYFFPLLLFGWHDRWDLDGRRYVAQEEFKGTREEGDRLSGWAYRLYASRICAVVAVSETSRMASRLRGF